MSATARETALAVLLLLLTGTACTTAHPAHPPAPASTPRSGDVAPPLAATLAGGGPYPSAGGHPRLLAFLDPPAAASRSQLAVLRSMAVQYGSRGLEVAVADATGRSTRDQLVNFGYDWDLAAAGVAVLALRDPASADAAYGVSALPAVVLIAPDGRITRRWDSSVVPGQDIALSLQPLLAPHPTP